MEIKCPNCGQACEVAEEPAIGQHLLCPFCDVKFNYTPQNTTKNDSNTAANAAEMNEEEPFEQIQTSCPHCGAVYEVDAAYIGETATCGTCDKAFVIYEAQEKYSSPEAVGMAAKGLTESVSGDTNRHIAATSDKKRIKVFTKAKPAANTTKCKPKSRRGNKIIVSGIATLAVVCGALYFGVIGNKDATKGRKDGQLASPTQATDEAVFSSTEMNNKKEASSTQSTRNANSASAKNNRKAAIALPPGSPSELLLKYAELGETDYVRAVLAQNPTLDVNRPKAAGNKTALYLACEKGFSDIVELLLKKNADTKICDAIPRSLRGGAHEYSPLTIAAKNGHLAILKMLLTAGKVNIESRDGNNRTALYAAAANNHPEAVRFLCQSKAKVNIQGVNKWTPLTAAAGQGYADVVKVLLQYGDNPDLEMPGGWPTGSPLLHAVKNNHPKVVEILCKAKAKVNIHCPPNNLTPLMESIDMGYAEVVKALLKYGNGLDVKMRGGRLSETALHRAVSQNNPEIVELLCKAGANVHAETGTYLGDLTTPLGRARYKGYSEVVKILVRYK